MLAKTIISFAALAASVSAILVTSPAKDAQLDFSKDVTITWTSVSTDPSTFTLELIDQSNVDSPIVINKDVKTSDDKYTLSNFAAPTGSTYKFNFISNDPQNSGILAQSQTFQIVKTADASSSSSASASASDSTTSTSSGTSEPTVVTTAVTGSVTTTNSAGVTTTMKTVSSKTSTASATSETSGAHASSTGAAAATSSNAAVVLDKTFAVGGGLLAALLMAF
jgi:hypothetical protein